MTIKIICDGAGMAREVNPYGNTEPPMTYSMGVISEINPSDEQLADMRRMKQDHALWTNFERTHPPLPVYHNSTLFMKKGEREGELVWHNPNLKGSWKFTYDKVGDKGEEQVYLIPTPSSVTAMGGEERPKYAGSELLDRAVEREQQILAMGFVWKRDQMSYVREETNSLIRFNEVVSLLPENWNRTIKRLTKH